MVGAQAAAFLAVTIQRACHNSFIEWAKGDDGVATYTVSSVIFVSQAFCVVVGWFLAYSTGGMADLARCKDIVPLRKFAYIGMIYAIGDIFEMESVNYIDSATYTVLSQSKLIITAVLMTVMDRSFQSTMQWFILFTTSAGMLEYVLVGKAKGGMTFSTIGICLALVKVFISCYVAVLNQRALKRDNHPFPVQFSCLKVSWAATSFVYMIVKDGLLGSGSLFGEWTSRTFVLVFAGFVLKTLFNQYLLKVLDAIWKNISEAIGVLLVYFARVLFLGGAFDGAVFNAAFIVILACVSYILTKSKPSEPKKKRDDVGEQLNPTAYQSVQASKV